MPELVGALMVHGQRVDMVREAEDRLLIPVCPPGVYLAEVRAAGVCVLYGHVEVLPSPLYEQEGVVCYTIVVDAKTDVLAVSLSMVEGIPGPRGEQGIQGERGLQGASAYDLAVAAGYEGSEAEWVAELQGAQTAANAARASEAAAAESARAAREDKAAAVQARDAALAAQSTAEEQAAIATKAAEDAQAPESIAAQSARPATMLLVRDELMSILGDASLFDIDTDGQKIIVHTDRLNDDKLAAVNDMLERFVPGFIEVVQYNHHIEVSWREYMKYSKCQNPYEMSLVNPDYSNDLTESGVWSFNLDSLTSTYSNVKGIEYLVLEQSSNVRKLFVSDAPRVLITAQTLKNLEEADIVAPPGANSIDFLLSSCPNLKKARICAPDATSAIWVVLEAYNLEELEFVGGLNKATNVSYMLFGRERLMKLKAWTTPLPSAKSIYYAFMGLRRFEVELPSVASLEGSFDRCQFDKDSVLRILNSIPAYTEGKHACPIGIHVDHQTDEEVLAAIANAEAKGWTLTVQWNGTPTAATASTFGFGQLIYAKVGEMKRPDGTTEKVLDWGHYVTNPEGYETFRSLESAYEYYGLPAEEGGEE